jgi:hypothetical protein
LSLIINPLNLYPMAKVTFGGGIVSMSGKMSGNVFSRNKGGAYVRAKITPSNPKTMFQTLVRGFMAAISQSWRALTPAQILAWNAAANTDASVMKGGDVIKLSGHQYHQQLNRNILEISGTVITDPPLRTAVTQLASISAVAAHATPALTVTYSPAIPVTEKVILFATAPCSPGKSNLNNKFRKIGVMASADSSPFAALALYTAKFGSIGAPGQRMAISMRPVIIASGIAGIPVTTEFIIGA